MDFIAENWPELLLALITFLGTVSAITESEEDDSWVDLIERIVNAILIGRSKGPKDKA